MVIGHSLGGLLAQMLAAEDLVEKAVLLTPAAPAGIFTIRPSVLRIFAPIMQPLGLGDWRVGASLVAGFIAKEGVVSSMEVLFGDTLTTILTPLTAATMLVFSLLYTPCLAAIATVRRELGGKWAVFVVIWQCVIAWVLAMAVKLVLMALGVQ